jgi:hypothetical protein
MFRRPRIGFSCTIERLPAGIVANVQLEAERQLEMRPCMLRAAIHRTAWSVETCSRSRRNGEALDGLRRCCRTRSCCRSCGMKIKVNARWSGLGAMNVERELGAFGFRCRFKVNDLRLPGAAGGWT